MSSCELTILGCSSQQPTRQRNHGAYLVRMSNEGLLFDPGEGTQRQFIFANVAPTCVTRIFISHFHGDHCLGLGSMLMRLNLDKVTHPIHCYYPASGKVYFDRLRFGSIYHETITVLEHPIARDGVVEEGNLRIEARFLEHGVDNIGWRIQQADRRKFDKEKLRQLAIHGKQVADLEKSGEIRTQERVVKLEEVSWMQPGLVFAMVTDTLPCQAAIDTARGASLFLCESTYLEAQADLARKYQHMTARQAAHIAKQAGAKMLVLTHFSARYQSLPPFVEEARSVFPNSYIAEEFTTFPFPARPVLGR